jgi:hypothetical protein
MFLLFVAIVALLVGIMGVAGLERMTAVQMLGVSGVLVTGLCFGSLSLSFQMRPGSLQRISARIVLASFGVGFLTGVALLFPWRSEPAFFTEGWPCMAVGLGVSAFSALLLWLVVRRGAALSIKTMGATLGATAGIFGLTVLQYKCPHQEALHLLAWHGGVLVMMTVAGTVIASLGYKISSRP